MNEEQKLTDRGKAAGGGEVSTRLPPFRVLHGGKTQRSAINHQFILTRMIFAAVFLYPYLLLNSLTSCASVELGSQISPVTSHFISNSSISSSNISNSNVRSNSSPLATDNHNSPHEAHSIGSSQRQRRRQVSTSEWIFSSLVQPSDHSSSTGQPQARQQSRRGNSGLSYYRSAPMVASSNLYTNYYRNTNIWQTPRRVDGDDKQLQNKNKHNSISSATGVESTDNNGERRNVPTASETPGFGLNRRRASASLSSLTNQLNRKSSTTASSKLPEVMSEQESGTTGLSRTAPATDPTLLITERPTSTQEMQISDEFSTIVDDDIQLGSRAEIGRARGGMKRGREMSDGSTVSFPFENNAPIVFPGTSTVESQTVRGNVRSRPEKSSETAAMGTFNPFETKILDGWEKLFELRKKSQAFETKKSSVASDQSADAKIISLLTIHGTPPCAGNGGYCEHIESYPRSFFNLVLNKTLSPDIFKGIFGETTDNNTVLTDVEFKLRHDFEESPLCSIREHTIYPKAAQNRKGKYMYIVNHDDYLQGIRVETCTRENDACMFTEGHLPGYSSTCKQKFIYKKLLGFNPEGKAMPDLFRLPSCCVCHVRSMFISDRINPGTDLGSSDIQPTIAADDGSWNPSSTTLTYPNHDDTFLSSSASPTSSSTTESELGSITFPTTSKSDFPTYQVPSPTTSTSSSQMGPHHPTGGQQQNNRAENQTASRRLH